jgi:uncharacterized membrane protein YdbT with pleckstrin-like domain
MSYVTKVLQPGERVLMLGRLHWIIYKNAMLAFILGLTAFWFAARSNGGSELASALNAAGMVLMAACICLTIAAWFNQWITEIAVTSQRVIYKRGFIQRYTWEMNMDKIESVTVTQSILGRLLNYGSIHVMGTGEGMEHLHQIKSPLELRSCITAR